MTSTRLRRILCPVDASEPSAQAGLQAIAFARWSGARVTALHVSEPISSSDPALLTLEAEHRRSWMRMLFREAFEAGIHVELVSRMGVPAREILACATDLPADLIVMGTHGAGGFEHLVLGSVTEKVLRRASCPVLTVPPRGVATSRLPFQNVLCALDFSDCSLAALEFAMTTAMGSGAALTLAHVLEWPWPEPPPPAFDELPRAEAEALRAYRQRRECDALARLQALAPEGLRDRCHARVSHGRSYLEILRLAAEEQADLIVLGVHGRSALDMAVFGSTTGQVVRHATCPVLTLRH
jgi:nucleotide-binding universal stress UspA family protein